MAGLSWWFLVEGGEKRKGQGMKKKKQTITSIDDQVISDSDYTLRRHSILLRFIFSHIS